MGTLLALAVAVAALVLAASLRRDLRETTEEVERLRLEFQALRRRLWEQAHRREPEGVQAPEVRQEPVSAAVTEKAPAPMAEQEAHPAPEPIERRTGEQPGPAVLSAGELQLLGRFLERRRSLAPEVVREMQERLVTRFEVRFPKGDRAPIAYLTDLYRAAGQEAVSEAPPGETPATDRPDAPPGAPEEAPTEPEPVAAGASSLDFETRVGTTWTLRIGLVALAIAAGLFAQTVLPTLPNGMKVALAYVGSLMLFGVGKFFEEKLEQFARPVMAGGLSLAFFVSFAAHFVPAMSSVPLVTSLAWMSGGVISVLVLAARWGSQPTAGLAIFLGHVSAFVAAGDADGYSLVAIAFLSVTAVVLLYRHDWLPLSLFAVVSAYASHLLWSGFAPEALAGPGALMLNVGFLTSYYVIFLAADLLWWGRRADAEPDEEVPAIGHILGPTNVVLYVFLTAILYLGIHGSFAGIEWFFFTAAGVQAALAIAYRRLRNPDFGFYAALAVVLLTVGFFAAFEALALNLILAVQALVLLLTAHRTRMRVFHLLAQGALAANFLHYWTVGAPDPVPLGFFLGSMAVVGVYFVKSHLEELWYGGGAEAWTDGTPPPPAVRPLSDAFDGTYGAIAPYLARVHAVAGSVILLREVQAYFPLQSELLVVVGALTVLGLASLFRPTVSLVLAYLTMQAGILYLAALDQPPSLLGRMAIVAAGLALASFLAWATRRTDEERIEPLSGMMRVALWLGIGVAFVLVPPASAAMPVVAQYLLWVVVVAPVFIHVALAPGGRAAIAEAIAGVALLVFVTEQVVGTVVAAPVWTSLWTVALVAAAGWMRSVALYAGGFAVLVATYGYYLVGGGLADDVAGSVLASGFVIVVPLTMAVVQDLLAHRRPEEGRPWTEWVTYLPYVGGSLFLMAVLGERLGFPWAMPAFTVLPLALLLGAGSAPLPRGATVSLGLAFLALVVHGAVLLEIDGTAILLPSLVLAVATLFIERLAATHFRESWSWVDGASMGLVVLATAITFLTVVQSALLGPSWTTAGWSLTATVVMVLGFVWRSAIYRRVALSAFALTLVRVFIVDMQGLSTGAQTVAFLILGLLLVAVAWLYSRFSEELKKWL